MEQSSAEHRRVIELGGVKFYVEQVSTTYTKLIPVDDPYWMLRFCEKIAPRADACV